MVLYQFVFVFIQSQCQTTRSEFEGEEFQVRRRYNDFIWLRQRLEECHPVLLVPVSLKSFLF